MVSIKGDLQIHDPTLKKYLGSTIELSFMISINIQHYPLAKILLFGGSQSIVTGEFPEFSSWLLQIISLGFPYGFSTSMLVYPRVYTIYNYIYVYIYI